MVPTNDFQAFATGAGANVETQAAYLADAQLPIGSQPGIARSAFVNKAIRQACYIASQIAQFLVNQTGQDCLDDATPANIQNLMAQVWPAPTGVIQAFGGSAAPVGYLLCDGTSYLRATYPNLFAVIGTTFGSADDTHFNVPNAEGIFLRGAGSQTISGVSHSATLGATVGDTLQGHYHSNSISDPGHDHIQGSPQDSLSWTGQDTANRGTSHDSGSVTGNSNNPLTTTSTTGISVTVDSPTSDGSHGTPRTANETAPASLGVTYIIKT